MVRLVEALDTILVRNSWSTCLDYTLLGLSTWKTMICKKDKFQVLTTILKVMEILEKDIMPGLPIPQDFPKYDREQPPDVSFPVMINFLERQGGSFETCRLKRNPTAR